MKKLILTPNVIPPESHGKNLRTMLPQDDWDLLRIDCYQQADYKCELCSGKGKKHPVEAHEEWFFDLEKRIQKLVKLSALCPSCHLVKHIGRAEKIGKFDKAFKHFKRINKLKDSEAQVLLANLMNDQIQLMTTPFRIDIEAAKTRLLEIYQSQEETLTAFPFQKRRKK